jgi:hypothetical protein
MLRDAREETARCILRMMKASGFLPSSIARRQEENPYENG